MWKFWLHGYRKMVASVINKWLQNRLYFCRRIFKHPFIHMFCLDFFGILSITIYPAKRLIINIKEGSLPYGLKSKKLNSIWSFSGSCTFLIFRWYHNSNHVEPFTKSSSVLRPVTQTVEPWNIKWHCHQNEVYELITSFF